MVFTNLMDAIRGWARNTIHDGVRLVAPLPEEGTITVHQHVPLRPIVEMVRAGAEGWWGAGATATLGPASLFSTIEGEHACLLSVDVKHGAGTTPHWVAVVAGDEHAVVIDATADPEHMPKARERVHGMAEYTYLALGEIRRRKYEYVPPKGWNGLRLPTATWWFHPGYPREMAVIKVFDVRPAAVTAPDVLDRILFIDPTIVNDEPPTPPIACRTPGGLMGYVVRGDGTAAGVPVSFAAAYFTDERFAYFMRYEARRDLFKPSMPAFAALTESVVAIPHAQLKATATHMIHWTE